MIGVISSQHRADSNDQHTCKLQEYLTKMKDIRTGSRYLDTLNFNKVGFLKLFSFLLFHFGVVAYFVESEICCYTFGYISSNTRKRI